MRNTNADTFERDTQTGATDELLLSIEQVQRLLGGCSTRHVYRMASAGRMPRPIKFGGLTRWRSAELIEWVNAGCPPARSVKGAAR